MPIHVLLVEDSPGDVRLTQEAFRDANPSIKFVYSGRGGLRSYFAHRQMGSSGGLPASPGLDR